MSSHKHLVEAVSSLPKSKIFVTFTDGKARIYDVGALVDKIPAFERLCSNQDLFYKSRPERSGLAVIWDDYFDLASDEIYLNGAETPESKAA
ncbi:MAG: DUF2442 domain-containing protein [Coriobacteriales bacterium]|jgi:hypothetical protein|nr:DUF2442 domain-containing protein [Coriobacteriales bacterium]